MIRAPTRRGGRGSLRLQTTRSRLPSRGQAADADLADRAADEAKADQVVKAAVVVLVDQAAAAVVVDKAEIAEVVDLDAKKKTQVLSSAL